jgi:hypothetical protein
MNGNAKKLAVLVMTAAIVMLMPVARASADGPFWGTGKALKGEYYFTGAGSCLVAPGGFNPQLQPAGGLFGPWFMNSNTWEGVYKFKPDGTGEMNGLFRVVEQYSSAIDAPPDAGLATVQWDFTYSVTHNGRITFNYTKGSYVGQWIYGPNKGTVNEFLYLDVPKPWYGTVSPDQNSIFVTWGVPLPLEPTADQANEELLPVSSFCNVVQTGFLCKGHCPQPIYSTP